MEPARKLEVVPKVTANVTLTISFLETESTTLSSTEGVEDLRRQILDYLVQKTPPIYRDLTVSVGGGAYVSSSLPSTLTLREKVKKLLEWSLHDGRAGTVDFDAKLLGFSAGQKAIRRS